MRGDYFENLYSGVPCMWFSQSADKQFHSKVILNDPRPCFWRFQNAVTNHVKHKNRPKAPQSTSKQESPEMSHFCNPICFQGNAHRSLITSPGANRYRKRQRLTAYTPQEVRLRKTGRLKVKPTCQSISEKEKRS
jgi:hypothetical protein